MHVAVWPGRLWYYSPVTARGKCLYDVYYAGEKDLEKKKNANSSLVIKTEASTSSVSWMCIYTLCTPFNARTYSRREVWRPSIGGWWNNNNNNTVRVAAYVRRLQPKDGLALSVCLSFVNGPSDDGVVRRLNIENTQRCPSHVDRRLDQFLWAIRHFAWHYLLRKPFQNVGRRFAIFFSPQHFWAVRERFRNDADDVASIPETECGQWRFIPSFFLFVFFISLSRHENDANAVQLPAAVTLERFTVRFCTANVLYTASIYDIHCLRCHTVVLFRIWITTNQRITLQ